jgi:hypothetical protein
MHPGSSRLNSITFLLRPPWLCLCGLGMAVCLGGTLLSAQNTPATSDAIPTLHVYTNLVQIPVLVLTPTREKLLAPIAPNRFSISFDGGPSFQPTYARLEGDDPIDLSIVLDIRSLQIDLIERIDQTIADLAPSFLHPGDHVSIYAYGRPERAGRRLPATPRLPFGTFWRMRPPSCRPTRDGVSSSR